MTCGIYEIVNAINGKRYVGQSVRIETRIVEHWKKLERGKHENKILQRAVDKYGLFSFYWRILEIVNEDKTSNRYLLTTLTKREQWHIDQTSKDMRYQIAPAAGSLAGHKRSEEFKRKISLSLQGRKHSLDTKIKISTSQLGKKNIR